ncbi:hypothetical protein Sjap_011106 [Stephania japonica]|uniref:Uncharacterized protein n=1 Tax=Stephania japonica TaxID=461633 RepID=A0AAP0JAR5_9MAGN
MEDPNNAYADIQSRMSFLDHHRLEYLNNTQHIAAALASSGGRVPIQRYSSDPSSFINGVGASSS